MPLALTRPSHGICLVPLAQNAPIPSLSSHQKPQPKTAISPRAVPASYTGNIPLTTTLGGSLFGNQSRTVSTPGPSLQEILFRYGRKFPLDTALNNTNLPQPRQTLCPSHPSVLRYNESPCRDCISYPQSQLPLPSTCCLPLPQYPTTPSPYPSTPLPTTSSRSSATYLRPPGGQSNIYTSPLLTPSFLTACGTARSRQCVTVLGNPP